MNYADQAEAIKPLDECRDALQGIVTQAMMAGRTINVASISITVEEIDGNSATYFIKRKRAESIEADEGDGR